MWFGTQAGLCRYDGYTFKTFRHDPGKNSISNNYIWNIYEDKEGILWITSFGGGINRYDPATEIFTQYKREKNGSGLSNNNTFAILELYNKLWTGTDDGFCSLDKSTGKIRNYLQTPGNVKGISSNHIGTIAWHQKGFLWMSSDSGLTRFNPATEEVNFFGKKIFGCSFNIERITKIRNRDNYLLITCDTGLVELDIENETAKLLVTSASLNTEKKARFTDVLPLAGNWYWINTDQGLVHFNSDTKQLKVYRHSSSNPASLAHNTVTAIFRLPSGLMWVGTRSGLDRIHHEQDPFYVS